MWQLALALGLIRQLSLAIVVERNMFAYYKVPAAQLLFAQESHSDPDSSFDIDTDFASREIIQHAGSRVKDLYYVLQCPPKLMDAIPKPQDMQTCSVVDEYRAMFQKKPPKPKKRLHMVPFRIVLRPLGPPAMRRNLKRRKRQHKDVSRTATEQENEKEASSPLQHLGRPHARQKLLKLAADHRQFKRGNSSKGYQHMYHRDEIYNDHIFYDEVHTDGEFHNYGKEKS
ncbi:uncharacterized protein LOC110189532 [Drosophila serrata]|uniref:uncharacterized protein LOC110189532 n=1 Tax=Drosophila serrata TaxID=7274 RepID=UPI000A1D1244|nr:uncharacterized protein LOC110189532 [Drosophila serrata]